MEPQSNNLLGLSVVVLLAMVLASCQTHRAREARLLQFGYGTPMAENLPDKIGPMEESNPGFDAFIVGVKLRGPCKAKALREGHEGRFCWSVFGTGRVRWDNVAADVKSLRAAAEKAKHLQMFLRFNVTPGNVDWFDPDWEAIVHNGGIAGRMTREGGCRGLFFDIEQYGKRELGQSHPFSYAYQPERKDHSFGEYAQQARRRGREWIEAFEKECPEAVIIFAWAHSNSVRRHWTSQGGKTAWDELNHTRQSETLLEPFIDGILEGAGPGITVYDGCEYTYGCRTKEDFELARMFVREGWRYSMVPKVYRRKMKAAFATEIDRDWRTRGGFHLDDPAQNYFTPEQLGWALHHSMSRGDGYSWLYSEAPRWWPLQKLSEDYLRALTEARKSRPFGLDPADFDELSIPIPKPVHEGIRPAKSILGDDAEARFADLWQDHEPVMDLPLTARFAPDEREVGRDEGWFARGFDDSNWQQVRVDEFWEHQGHATLDGIGWYRLRFMAPADLPGTRTLLSFGAVDEEAAIYLNGRHIGDYLGPWNRRFEVDVTGTLQAGKENVLVLRVFGGFGAGGIWAPIKMIAAK